MERMVAWFAKNSVAANLVMFVVVAAGLLTTFSIKTELFPEFSIDLVTVTVPYPGAAPEEVEEAICVRIEEEIHSLDGVKKVTSRATEGMGVVTIEVVPGEDQRRILDDVKTRVDAIDTFPELAEQPIIQEILMRAQVINIAVSGDTDEVTLKRLGERVRDEINNLPGVTQVELASARPYEISIETSEEELRRYGLTFSQVADAVRAGSLDLSGGSVKTRGGEVLLRTKTQAYRGAEFEEIVVRSRRDGSRVLLRDVATVVDGFEESEKEARFDGEPAVMIQVFRVGDQNALTVADTVRKYVESARATMPEGIKLTVWGDAAVFLQGRLDLLIKNGLQGLALVFLVLALFLRFRLAFWVTLGIPISFLGAMWLLPSLDQSLNMLSLFAFILVLGIVVDDAIVVGESIFAEQKGGRGQLEGAIRGAQRVAVPVTFAVLTTAVAFTPMLGLPGMMGKFFKVVPLVVIPTLLFSWIESKMVLPAHLAHGGRWTAALGKLPPFSWWVRFQGAFERGMEWFALNVYQRSLQFFLEWRYLTVALALSSLLLVVGLYGGGFVKFVFFNPIEGDIVAAQLTMPLGTSADETRAAIRRMEQAAEELKAELDAEHGDDPSVLRHFMSSLGEQPYKAQQENNGIMAGGGVGVSHLGEVVMELTPAEERDVLSSDIVRRWRELTGPIPGAVELVFSADIMSAGDAINIQFAGTNVDELRAAAAELKARMAEYPGVFDITDSFRGGKQEIQLDILPQAQALGLTRADLARQVRQGFHGEEVQRIQRGRDELKVMVRYPEEDRRTLHGLESMRVRTPLGAEVPFSTVADARLGRGYAAIERSDRRRTVRVTADVDSTQSSANEILDSLTATVLPDILERHPTVSYTLEGENREQMETVEVMSRYALLALIAIYALMAVPFRSYFQPLIVMSAIPFGLVGAVLGHWILGWELSLLSLCGIIALAGVVVNDSLVLVDFVNRRREEGLSAAEAARTAGLQRFRPIILTSLTTFMGLTPLILEESVQAAFLIPMAVSLAYGVLFSTLISLVLVPAGYLIQEDMIRARDWVLRVLFGFGEPPEPASPKSREQLT